MYPPHIAFRIRCPAIDDLLKGWQCDICVFITPGTFLFGPSFYIRVLKAILICTQVYRCDAKLAPTCACLSRQQRIGVIVSCVVANRFASQWAILARITGLCYVYEAVQRNEDCMNAHRYTRRDTGCDDAERRRLGGEGLDEEILSDDRARPHVKG